MAVTLRRGNVNEDAPASDNPKYQDHWRGSGFVIPTQTLCPQARILPSHKTLRTGLQIPSGVLPHHRD